MNNNIVQTTPKQLSILLGTFCFTVIFLLSANVQRSFAQGTQLENVISSSSPTAAGLSRYIDFPVSLNNGIPEISIPLYTLTSSSLKVPISLSYHAGGIKVVDRTTTMGLGWTLNAGGVLNRVMHGLPDELAPGSTVVNGGWLNTVWPSDVIGSGSSLAVNNVNEICSANYLFNTYITDHAYTYLWDGEPDVFYFSAPNLGGKFLYRNSPDASGQRAVVIPYQPIKIDNSGSLYTITGTDGVIYQFGPDIESFSSDQTSLSPYNATTAWLLSKMISADRSDTITFKYGGSVTFEKIKQNKSISVRFTEIGGNTTPNPGGIGNSATVTPGGSVITHETTRALTEIKSKNTDITFTYSGSDNLTPLQSIDIFSILNGVKQKIKTFSFSISQISGGGANSLKLNAVNETGYKDGVAVSNPPYKINYMTGDAPPYDSYAQDLWGYYNGQTSNTDLTMVNVAYTSELQFTPQKRMPDSASMMKGMIKSIIYPTGGKTDFTFEPNQITTTTTTSVPVRSTVTIGNITTTHMVPNDATTGIDLTFTVPAPPTGFTVESYNFNFQGDVNTGYSSYVTNKAQAILIDLTSGFNVENVVLNQLESGQVTNQVYNDNPYHGGGYEPIQVGHTYHLYFYDQGVVSSWSEATKYRLSASLTENLTGSSQTQTQTQTILAGGLRIKNITHTDPLSGDALVKTYNYTKPYFIAPNVFNGDYAYFYNTCLTKTKWWFSNYRTSPSDPFNKYTSNIYVQESPTFPVGGAGNSSIAYQEVEELNTSAKNGTSLGKTVYTFNTATDYIPLRIPTIRFDHEDVRKQLLDTKIYKNVSGSSTPVLIKEITNTYSNVNDESPEVQGAENIKLFIANSDYDFTYLSSSMPASSGVWSATGCPVFEKDIPFTLLALYYNIAKTFLSSTSETAYTDAGSITTTTNYAYGNYAHMQPTLITTTSSDHLLKKQFLKYPLDYAISGLATNPIAQGIQNLQNNHIISPVIETYTQKSNIEGTNIKTTSALFTSYEPTIPYPAAIYAIQSAAPLSSFTPTAVTASATTFDSYYKQRISFNQYDSKPNLVEQQKVSDVKHSYVWDYDGVYPIAETVNAAQSNTAYTSFEADGTGNWTINSVGISLSAGGFTGQKCYGLSSANTMTKTGLTSGNYIVTYWKKNGVTGTVAINGGSPGTSLIAKRGWTLYSRILNNVSSVTISGAGGVIDEVRLYPAGAQMTTYTYSPLIGMTSQCDAANHVTMYEYDGLGRLSLIRDQDNNIIKKMDYHYNGQPETSPACSCDDPIHGKRCINDQCQQGVRVNTSTVKQANGTFKCVYHWEWPNFSGIANSANITEYNTDPCFID